MNLMLRPNPGTRCTEGLVDYRAGLDVSGKVNPLSVPAIETRFLGSQPPSLFTAPTALFTIPYIRVNILQTVALLSIVDLKSGLLKERLVCRDI